MTGPGGRAGQEESGTLARLFLAAMRRHDRAAVLLHQDGTKWRETPDWRFERQVIRLALFLRERAQSFRAQAREVAASSRALGYLAGLDGGSSCQYLTHAEAVARMRALRTELPARKGAVALVAAPPTLAARLALLSFVFDGLTICAVGTPGRESVGLQPEWVVGPAGVQESERSAAPAPRRAAGLFERVLAPFRSDPRKAKLEM